MVGMISCVVLIFPLRQNRAPTRNPRWSFFPELHPINCPYVVACFDLSSAGRAVGAATLGLESDLTSPNLLFSENLFKLRRRRVWACVCQNFQRPHRRTMVGNDRWSHKRCSSVPLEQACAMKDFSCKINLISVNRSEQNAEKSL